MRCKRSRVIIVPQPRAAHMGSKSARNWAEVGPKPLNVGRNVASSGPSLADFAPTVIDFGPTRSIPGQIRASVAEIRPESVGIGHTVVDSYRFRGRSGHCWSKSAYMRVKQVRPWPIGSHSGVDAGPICPRVRRNWPKFDRLRSEIGKLRPECCRILASSAGAATSWTHIGPRALAI